MLILTALSAVFSTFQLLPLVTVATHTEKTYSEQTPLKDNPLTFNNDTSSFATSQQTIPATTNGKVLGSIKETVLSPYNAPLKYNKVYLKNSAGVNIDLKALLNQKLKIDIKNP